MLSRTEALVYPGVSLELLLVNKVTLLGVTKSLRFFPGGINEKAIFSGSVSQVEAAPVVSW